VLTEEQIATLAVGSVIRVWEGRWDCGIIRACNVMAHRMTLLGDGEVHCGDSAGIHTAVIPSPEPRQSEQESDGGDTTGAMTSDTAPVAVTSAVAAVAAADADTSESGTCGSTGAASATDRLLDLGLFASRGKLRFVDDVRPTGGTAILSVGERRRQLTQWQFGLGDLVWARLKPFPPWPAMISCNPKTCAWRRGDQYRQVVFFGDYTHRAMPVGDLVAFNRQTLQSYSNLGWQSTSDTQTGELESGVAADAGRKTSQDRLRQKAIATAFHKFFLPIEQGMKASTLRNSA
jgi:hypothetical protein